MASPSSAPEYISKVRDAYTPFRLPKLYPMGEDDQSPPHSISRPPQLQNVSI